MYVCCSVYIRTYSLLDFVHIALNTYVYVLKQVLVRLATHQSTVPLNYNFTFTRVVPHSISCANAKVSRGNTDFHKTKRGIDTR